MQFGLAITTSYGVDTSIISSLSDDIGNYFSDKYYGEDIKSYTIGVLCVSPQFDQFYAKTTKPKYTKGRKIIKPDGIPFELEDSYEYRVKIDHASFTNADDIERKEILATAILASLSVLDKLSSKIKDFDKVRFKADIESYFRP